MKVSQPGTKLTALEQEAIQELTYRLQEELGPDFYGLMLYGSKARGDAAADSDVDLLVIVEMDDWPIRDKISQIASRISLALDVLLSPHVTSLTHYRAMMREPYSFYRNVFSEALPLYGPDRLFP
jgi:uncharacterized protein